jgi:hypothetical protein
LNSELIERIPELFAGYAELRAMWDGDEPGPHVVYEDLLVPYLARLLRAEDSEVGLLRIFALLEDMARSNDQSIRDVLGASVLEGLHECESVRAQAAAYMGPLTRQLAYEVASGWDP